MFYCGLVFGKRKEKLVIIRGESELVALYLVIVPKASMKNSQVRLRSRISGTDSVLVELGRRMFQVDLYKSCEAHTYMYGERGRGREKKKMLEKENTQKEQTFTWRRKENRHPHKVESRYRQWQTILISLCGTKSGNCRSGQWEL